ncbi:ABC transporter permease [Sphingomonas sp. RP10(2022)]|uniref:ABC transporter permease n=1 Tax=Sphingomonas liriopis TaxID=2949094 RepID=A0A9X2KNT2_9SPHN|nr:ABC transporter permease [Sphingomonas liriopis]MCP3733974.1 ABC transporter permease [Sphingomonas liriopis]
MSNLLRTLRQAMTIARRDFIATVFTPIFLLFLFAPVIMGSFGAIGGMGAASVADGRADKTRIVAIVPDANARTIAEADTRLRAVFRRDEEAPPGLTTLRPAGDPAAQARAAFASKDYEATAVLYGPLETPQVLYGPRGKRAADYLGLLAAETLAANRLNGDVPRVTAVKTALERQGGSAGNRRQSASFAVFGVFLLNLFLASQVVGTMAEERNNKVIEVLAAAVPLESVFLGKLLGMFGVAILFVGFWGTIIAKLGSLLPPDVASALAIQAAVGTPAFVVLFVTYFTMAYLLLGSAFLVVGAQASTPREIQMLALPISVLQMGMLALALAGTARPDGWIATVAQMFPLSSPFAMAGRAATSPDLWPHIAAIAWQLLWVTIFITLGARLFRRGVLQSGSAKPFWKRARG